MPTLSSINKIFGIFDSCCTYDTRNKQDLYDFEIDEQHFKDRLSNCIDITVLLEDGTRLSCTMHVDFDKSIIRISCDRQVREIEFKSVKKILHTKDELDRVQTSGSMINYNTALAFHLLENGNCIPINLNNSHEKKLFINLIKPYIQV